MTNMIFTGLLKIFIERSKITKWAKKVKGQSKENIIL